MKTPLLSLLALAAALLAVTSPGAQAQFLGTPDLASYGGGGPNLGGGGGYGASIPLEFPAARGGLPLPVSVANIGTRMGAAGRGWDVPISFVREDHSLAYRRPNGAPGSTSGTGAPSVNTKVTLNLLGSSVDLLLKDGVWIAQRDATGLIAKKEGSEWKVYDQSGHTYVFKQDTQQLLAPLGMWLLDRIEGAGGAKVSLEYRVATQANLPADDSGVDHAFDGVVVDLEHVKYNYSETGSPKNQIDLVYAEGVTIPPLSINVMGDGVMVRVNTLSHIDLSSRAQAGGVLKRLARYDLTYQIDPDMQRPQLRSVSLSGEEGTPEALVNLPLASYEYGTAVTAAGAAPLEPGGVAYALNYQKTAQPVLRPLGSYEEVASTQFQNGGTSFAEVRQQLIDMTGDGRADLVFQNGNGLYVARNKPGANGVSVLNDVSQGGSLNDTVLSTNRLDYYETRRFDPYPNDAPDENTDENVDTWTQVVDVNGDGRPDVINARELAGWQWVIYLNKPLPGVPSKTQWERKVFNVGHLQQMLSARGYDLSGGTYVPLMRQHSTNGTEVPLCWEWSDSQHNWHQVSGYAECSSVEHNGTSATVVDWRLMDFNGDGGLDLLMASRAQKTLMIQSPPTHAGSVDGVIDFNHRKYRIESDVMLDVSFSRGSSSDDLIPLSAPVSMGGCGVSRIEGFVEICGVGDVNGDGLADLRTVSNPFTTNPKSQAQLGTGMQFSAARVDLPKGAQFVNDEKRGLLDVTGDGIPDLVNGATIRIGTGTGFSAPRSISGDIAGGIVLSKQGSNANEPYANRTVQGLYDLDGDGRPEQVKTNGLGFDVYRLTGSSGAGALSAGLLTAIDNAHGGRTEITYKSAKDDGSTDHQLPQAEIVVSSVKTKQASTGQIAETRYAYGSPIFGFDLMEGQFHSFGYGRTIAVTPANGVFTSQLDGNATITDANPLVAPATADYATLFSAYLRAGRTANVQTLSGAIGDPWGLLATDLNTDGRRTGASVYTYDSKVFGVPSTDSVCPTWDPMCSVYGFMYTRTSSSWHGTAALPSTDNVMTNSQVLAIDDLGRVTSMFFGNDARRDDDNQCLQTTYATPEVGAFPRVLGAVASTELRHATAGAVCTGTGTYVVSSGRTLYDGLPQGQVSLGWPTAKIADRRDGTTLMESIRLFDAQYDGYGNPLTVTTDSGDGRTRTVTVSYDDFGLAAQGSTVVATGAATTTSNVDIDPYTVMPVKVTDANQIEYGTIYDGFQRPILSTVKPQGGQTGVMASATYVDFENVQGRHVETKTFDNPVMPATVAAAQAAAGHKSTVYLDDFGRSYKAKINLGGDFTDEMVVGETTFDRLGRPSFVADPYPTSQAASTAYGTTYHYNTDGSLMCSIRGRGPQARPTKILASSDQNVERLATCYSNDYQNGQFIAGVWLPDATHEFPGERVKFVSTLDAIGRTISRETLRQTNTPAERLEYSTFAYDDLGHVARMTRFLTPNGSTPLDPVNWNFRYDSFGQLLEQLEPNVGTNQTSRTSTYSHWGEILSNTSDVFPAGTATGPAQREVMEYDGLGRLVHRWQERGREVLRETNNTYTYDYSTNAHPALDTVSMLGRPASAVSPTATVHFGYDEFGRVKATAHEDAGGKLYISTSAYDADGTLTELGALLPDTGYKREYMKYRYDSARNLRIAAYVDENGLTRTLFQGAEVDVFGRLRAAKFAAAIYTADYADNGRRLFQNMALLSSTGKLREITNQGYDPLGREIARTETVNATSLYTQYNYDTLGRLSGSLTRNPADPNRTIIKRSQMTYDALGNLLLNDDLLSNDDVSMSYQTTSNLDRLCSIGYNGTAASTTQCNVVHDDFGNILQQPTATGQRQFSYLPSGAVSGILQSGASATYAYGPFGEVQSVAVTGPATEPRQDRRFGDFELRNVGGVDVLERNLPIGDGTATRKGATDRWVLSLGESRGNRYFVDQEGELIQETEYNDFGDPTSTGAPVNSPAYSRAQWNGGDRLASFGLSHLGARLYDPKIGRFLSPDPLVLMRTATTSNPYAFADNDPINKSDPSGLCPGSETVCTDTSPTDIGNPNRPIGHTTPGGSHSWYHPPAPVPPPAASGALDSDDVARRQRQFDSQNSGPSQAELEEKAWQDAQGAAQLERTRCLQSAACFRLSTVSPGEGIKGRPFASSSLSGYLAANAGLDVAGIVLNVTGAQQAIVAARHELNDALQGTSTPLSLDEVVAMIPLPKLGSAPKRLGPCPGGTCRTGETCFVAGTLVATEAGHLPIESLDIGNRVEAGNAQCGLEHLPADAVTIELDVVDSTTGNELGHVRLVRSRGWLQQLGLEDGVGYVDMPKVNLVGEARVRSVTAPPAESKGNGCLVLSTIDHIADHLIELDFQNGAKLELTPPHRMYVESKGWVAASLLREGDLLRTDSGTLKLVSVKVAPPGRRVYNLEVDLEHTYRVTSSNLWTHNSYADIKKALDKHPLGPSATKADLNELRSGVWHRVSQIEALERDGEAYLKNAFPNARLHRRTDGWWSVDPVDGPRGVNDFNHARVFFKRAGQRWNIRFGT